MGHVISKDGTHIAFDKSGQGPAIILVLGAFNDRNTGTDLARALAPHFTVLNYDRRGRGQSGDRAPYTVMREIEDIEALILEAGGQASLFGFSSGAILALRAAAQVKAVSKLVLFEPPPTGGRAGDIAPRLSEHIAAGRRGEAVELFQTDAVGIPAAVVAQLRQAPFRPALENIAHTLVYDATLMQALPAGLTTEVTMPALVLDGSESPPVMHAAAQSLAGALTHARYQTLPGVGHDIIPAVIGPVMEKFLLQ